jgi:hypothetical protein
MSDAFERLSGQGLKINFYTVMKECDNTSIPSVSCKAIVSGCGLQTQLHRQNRPHNRRNHRSHRRIPHSRTRLVEDGNFFFLDVAVVVRT